LKGELQGQNHLFHHLPEACCPRTNH
jgi:hypothetical protein